MTAKLAESDSARDASERMIALGRLGDAHDVARAIEFLLHPDSCYITGGHMGSRCEWESKCMSFICQTFDLDRACKEGRPTPALTLKSLRG